MSTAIALIQPIPVLIALPVSTKHRGAALATYSGQDSIRMKLMVYDFMSTLCRTYAGDYWHMYELTNGGFYMAPSDTSRTYDIYWAANAFSDTLSADAAGIVSCLLAYRRLSFTSPLVKQRERYEFLYQCLYVYVFEHPESALILRAVDTELEW